MCSLKDNVRLLLERAALKSWLKEGMRLVVCVVSSVLGKSGKGSEVDEKWSG